MRSQPSSVQCIFWIAVSRPQRAAQFGHERTRRQMHEVGLPVLTCCTFRSADSLVEHIYHPFGRYEYMRMTQGCQATIEYVLDGVKC